MADKPDLCLLTELTARSLDTDPADVRLSPIGTGHHNATYWVHSPAGRFVLRVAPHDDAGFVFYERRMMRQEPGLHALIRSRTTIPVPKILDADFTRTRLDRDWLLMSALPGQPVNEMPKMGRSQFAKILQQTGQHLRQLHNLKAYTCLGVDAYGYLGAHRPMEPQATWLDAFRLMWNRLLDDVVACGAFVPEEGNRFRGLFERHSTHFDRPVAPSLLHMDIWAPNILADTAGNVTGIVDFDRALWGDPEIEFAILDYTGFSDPPFWEGYGEKRDTSPPARIRQRFYLLYEVLKYMPIFLWRGRNPKAAEEYRQQSSVLAEPLLR